MAWISHIIPLISQEGVRRGSEENSTDSRSARKTLRRRRRAKPLLAAFFRELGLAVYRYREDYHYCPSVYGSGYWKKIDIKEIPDFSELAKEVINQKRTLLFYDRLHVIYQAIWNVRHLTADTVSMAEVGVYRGGGTYFIASVADRLFEKKPKIHAFDTFEGHPDEMHPAVDDDHWQGKFADTSFSDVQSYLARFSNVRPHKGRFQDRCEEVSGEQFSFVHVDVDIFSATRACLDFFADRLLSGGIMVVDDYGITTCMGVQEAVDRFVSERKHFFKLHLNTGQCVLIRIF